MSGHIALHRVPRPMPPPRLPTTEFGAGTEEDLFLGKIVKSVARTAGRTVSQAGRTIGKVSRAVGRIPVVGDVARAGVNATRLSLGPLAIAADAGARLARGQNLGRALKGAVTSHVSAARDQLRLAQMVAPFIPGIGTGVAAALAAANALADGRRITDAVMAAARNAVPGGAVAQAAFDTAVNLARGRNITQAMLEAARARLPGGAAAQAAFDGALALAQGRKLQDAAFAAAGRVLPPSPYAANTLAFVKRVSQGQNVQRAALSVAGRRALQSIERRTGVALG